MDDPTPCAKNPLGGPGCSSMIGLFQENGPCKFTGSSTTPVNNSYSFNNYANMIYIDQPIGVGFSYGTDDVTSTVTAAPYVWKLIQAFYASFPQYESRDFGIFTESYGGHYGPEFTKYIQDQNKANAGEKINIVALGVNNGWIDFKIQEKAYVQFSYNNTYKPLITQSQYNTYMSRYTNNCLPAINSCYSSGSNSACQTADNTCYNQIEGPLSSVADFDVYDIRAPSQDPNPPENYVTYLGSSAVKKAIGAQSTYQECANAPGNKFSTTGDSTYPKFELISCTLTNAYRPSVFPR
jgi:carboxypeptidase D